MTRNLIAGLLLGTVLASPAAFAQTSLPDWSGSWSRAEGVQLPQPKALLPYLTPSSAKIFAGEIANHSFRVPWSSCDPGAVPAMMTEEPLPFEFLFTPGRATLIMADDQVRRIYTEPGAQHYSLKTGETSYFGDSIGHWEGDTLVVDTVGLNTDNQVVIGYDNNDNLHVVERIRKIDADTLADTLTVTGFEGDIPGKPFVRTQTYKHSTNPVRENLCVASKNRDTGTSLNLTPPP